VLKKVFILRVPTTNILNKNWLHIRDSSTLDGLTVIPHVQRQLVTW